MKLSVNPFTAHLFSIVLLVFVTWFHNFHKKKTLALNLLFAIDNKWMLDKHRCAIVSIIKIHICSERLCRNLSDDAQTLFLAKQEEGVGWDQRWRCWLLRQKPFDSQQRVTEILGSLHCPAGCQGLVWFMLPETRSWSPDTNKLAE